MECLGYMLKEKAIILFATFEDFIWNLKWESDLPIIKCFPNKDGENMWVPTYTVIFKQALQIEIQVQLKKYKRRHFHP